MATPQDSSPPSFFTRIALAIGSFFRILGDAAYAARVQGVDRPAEAAPEPAPVTPPPTAVKPVPPLKEATPDAALQLLGLLQREARLIDFVEEDVAAYSDAEIGGAARLVHEGCRKVLREHFTLAPARDEAEGSRIVLNEGFDAAAVRLTGNVVGTAPYRGTLSHRGWRVTDVRLPRLAPSHDAKILAAAEVEL
ncbi:DUF2760 domain-containing protein [soil metagenome]